MAVKIAFLYPGLGVHDALPNWVAALARHCKAHEVFQATAVAGCPGADVVLALTQHEVYPTAKIDADLAQLRKFKVPFGVVHNQDNPAVPTAVEYPNFVWTQASWKKLAHRAPALVRMPVLPGFFPRVNYEPVPATDQTAMPLHVATFGACEPKKHVVQMAQRCKAIGVPFTCYTPHPFVEAQQNYHDRVRALAPQRDNVVVHPWAERVEDLSYLFSAVSHFLFVLPPGKGGTGGSPTSCRYVTAFGRPVVVVDDEPTYMDDAFTVLKSLEELTPETLRMAGLPNYRWLPDDYVGRLAKLTLEYWERKP